jgi:hypothetical protein
MNPDTSGEMPAFIEALLQPILYGSIFAGLQLSPWIQHHGGQPGFHVIC